MFSSHHSSRIFGETFAGLNILSFSYCGHISVHKVQLLQQYFVAVFVPLTDFSHFFCELGAKTMKIMQKKKKARMHNSFLVIYQLCLKM